MSALAPESGHHCGDCDVCFVPEADVARPRPDADVVRVARDPLQLC